MPSRLALLFIFLGLLCCDSTPAGNPRSLWINYSHSELNLELIDHEPPPF